MMSKSRGGGLVTRSVTKTRRDVSTLLGMDEASGVAEAEIDSDGADRKGGLSRGFGCS